MLPCLDVNTTHECKQGHAAVCFRRTSTRPPADIPVLTAAAPSPLSAWHTPKFVQPSTYRSSISSAALSEAVASPYLPASRCITPRLFQASWRRGFTLSACSQVAIASEMRPSALNFCDASSSLRSCSTYPSYSKKPTRMYLCTCARVCVCARARAFRVRACACAYACVRVCTRMHACMHAFLRCRYLKSTSSPWSLDAPHV